MRDAPRAVSANAAGTTSWENLAVLPGFFVSYAAREGGTSQTLLFNGRLRYNETSVWKLRIHRVKVLGEWVLYGEEVADYGEFARRL